ncbi:MAG: hypothetical protein ACPKQO_05405 [Nitrososphaeraceae archaeon]
MLILFLQNVISRDIISNIIVNKKIKKLKIYLTGVYLYKEQETGER